MLLKRKDYKLIVFNKEKIAKYILKHGLNENDADFNYKMKLVATHLIHNTQYAPCEIKKTLTRIADKYFNGMPEEYVQNFICKVYDKAKKIKSIHYDDVTVIVYQSEMNKILTLENYNLQKLAFVLLVYSKYCGCLQPVPYKYKWIEQAMPDMFRLAEIKASGKTKNELVYRLVQSEMLCVNSFLVKNRNAGRKSKIMFYIPYQHENQEPVRTEDVPEIVLKNFDDMILYFQRFLNDKGVQSCCECSEPILKTSNSRKFCSDCAVKNKHVSNQISAQKAV